MRTERQPSRLPDQLVEALRAGPIPEGGGAIVSLVKDFPRELPSMLVHDRSS